VENQNSLLRKLFTDIANSICLKTNKTETIDAINFPIEIESIETVNEATARMEIAETKTADNYNLLVDLIERDVTEVVFPEGVTNIGVGAFAGCSKLEYVYIPDSVTTMGGTSNSADIFNSAGVKAVRLSPNVKTLPPYLFAEASKLESITIPHGVTTIGRDCFQMCYALTEMWLPNTITAIGFNFLSGGYIPKNITKLTLEKGFNYPLDVSGLNSLSAEVLVAIFESLADLTGLTAKTLTLGTANLAKLTDEQKAIATNKNWTLA
jgi:hypothetical protein